MVPPLASTGMKRTFPPPDSTPESEKVHKSNKPDASLKSEAVNGPAGL